MSGLRISLAVSVIGVLVLAEARFHRAAPRPAHQHYYPCTWFGYSDRPCEMSDAAWAAAFPEPYAERAVVVWEKKDGEK